MFSYGDLAIILAVLFSGLGGVGILFALSRWRGRRDAGLFRAAETLGGSVAATEGFELPSLHFVVEGRPAVMEYDFVGEDSLTRVKVFIQRRSPGAFRIFRHHGRENARFNGFDLKIGHPEFDRAWYITARPESLARRIFSDERRDQVIESVLRIGAFASPSIEITRDSLIVRANGFLNREADVMALARTAIDFVGYVFRLGPEEGIAWMTPGEGEPGLCPVCTVALSESVVFCDKCRTPQHEECWVYVGQCSTYACRGKRFVA